MPWLELTCPSGAGAWLHTSQPAQAIREVQLPDGSTVFAYELDVDLKIVALRSSVPSDAILDFRRALSKYGHFQLAQRPQIADIFEELGQPRSAQSCGPPNCSQKNHTMSWSSPRMCQSILMNTWLSVCRTVQSTSPPLLLNMCLTVCGGAAARRTAQQGQTLLVWEIHG